MRLKNFLIALLCFFHTACAEEENYRVVFLGNGVEDGVEKIDSESLVRLLKKIKGYQPDLLFFTGNLIEGLEQSTTLESMRQFENVMDEFTRLVRLHLGNEVRLYPVLGNHTFVNSRAIELFKKHFDIPNSAPLEPYQAAYAVHLDRVQFVVLATGIFERKFRGYRHPLRTMPLLDWLEKELRTGDYRFRFVIGHMPAFSTKASEGVFVGEDREPERRDLFWRILKQNGALGYFCSHEPLYDRSNRNGVWQVISGGIGADGQGGGNVFEHFMLLTVPKKPNGNPRMRAIDLSGQEWDTFEIIPIDRPVHHLRISGG